MRSDKFDNFFLCFFYVRGEFFFSFLKKWILFIFYFYLFNFFFFNFTKKLRKPENSKIRKIRKPESEK